MINNVFHKSFINKKGRKKNCDLHLLPIISLEFISQA